MKTLASSLELGNATPSILIESALAANALGPANANRLLFARECGLEIEPSTFDMVQEISAMDESNFHPITKYILPLLRVAGDFQAGDRVHLQPPEKHASPKDYEIKWIESSNSTDEDPMDSETESLFDRADFVVINPDTELINEEIGVQWPGLVPLELSDLLRNKTEDRRSDFHARVTSRFGIFYFRMSFFSDLVTYDTPYKDVIYRSLRWHHLVPPLRLKD